MFSKACEYGIKATIYIAMQSKEGHRVSLNEIAKATNSPVAFTAKILQILTKNNIVDSMKGPTGGFVIDSPKMEKIKLSQIVYAIDGDNIYKGCGLGLSKCSETKPCPVHDKFARIRNELRFMLENTNILELAEGTLEGLTYLKR
jgi:Rrf2 family transcriptional regulator, iron-sulfur cluster assembly transcription factor